MLLSQAVQIFLLVTFKKKIGKYMKVKNMRCLTEQSGFATLNSPAPSFLRGKGFFFTIFIHNRSMSKLKDIFRDHKEFMEYLVLMEQGKVH